MTQVGSDKDVNETHKPYFGMYQMSMAQQSDKLNLRNCILLDNESTVHAFCNPRFVEKIFPAALGDEMTLLTNGGQITTRNQCRVQNLDQPVWYDSKFITNILSLGLLKAKYRITYDSSQSGEFIVHREHKSNLVFKPHPGGLHLIEILPNQQVSLVETVTDRKRGFSSREVSDAKKAREVQVKMGLPSDQSFKQLINYGLVKNCPVTTIDVDNALKIFGPSVASLKGKTSRTRPDRIRQGVVEVPIELLRDRRDVTLHVDVMQVNSIPFLVTISEDLGFTTIESLPSSTSPTVLQAIKTVIKVYKFRDFFVRNISMDNAFTPLEGDLVSMSIIPNFVSASEHVPHIERRIRVIKERMHALRHTLPFRKVPKLLIRELGKFTVMWLNAFPNKGGLQDISPRVLITGVPLDYNIQCRLPFGAYVQTHEEVHIRNGPEALTCGAISLGPNMSTQYGYWFMSLQTGKRIHRCQWTELPMPQEVISRVERLALLEHQPSLITFSDRNGISMDDEPDLDEIVKELPDSHSITGVYPSTQNDVVHNAVVPEVLNDFQGIENPVIEDESEGEINVSDPVEYSNKEPNGEMEDSNQDDADKEEEPFQLRRSIRNRTPIVRLDPSFKNKTYGNTMCQMR